ncbi:hypothetical protein BU24DRAFT_407193 [Aaosphaeria arxii CBS 175.79]|uniref:Uncharacterized protein n=1 Tax=Aaosphaeria arxii CBS 175.79 TaxID=1450172 RepID=A0A6A5XWB2_9PLEO|nr:uncharacterized protein BU24DRAFT_407193 [Aaosphaeria arxii CBS 175.79]KAF2017127.1 hypothetical protein BU24DRAFT_407193 [Aaosphaeria arxii CBS 175.79]
MNGESSTQHVLCCQSFHTQYVPHGSGVHLACPPELEEGSGFYTAFGAGPNALVAQLHLCFRSAPLASDRILFVQDARGGCAAARGIRGLESSGGFAEARNTQTEQPQQDYNRAHEPCPAADSKQDLSMAEGRYVLRGKRPLASSRSLRIMLLIGPPDGGVQALRRRRRRILWQIVLRAVCIHHPPIQHVQGAVKRRRCNPQACLSSNSRPANSPLRVGCWRRLGLLHLLPRRLVACHSLKLRNARRTCGHRLASTPPHSYSPTASAAPPAPPSPVNTPQHHI